ncbi:hypothetical protein ACFTRD_29570 [Paenibacillus sp. NPDC056933]|uniref:hypothetical protein n=1 Tax=Paenibacillus sp. NPDC056933 TaxID=3345968 RepID=UPI00364011A5
MIGILISAVILGGITYYLNTIIPKPETIKALFTYLYQNPGKYLLTTFMNIASFVSVFLAGGIIIGVSVVVLFNNDEWDLSIVQKILVILLGLVGLVALIFSFVYLTYLSKLVFVIILAGLAALVIVWLISESGNNR